MKAVNKATFEVSRALISAMFSLHHFTRSKVNLLLEPRRSYFVTRVCKSSKTIVHPPRTTLSRASRSGGSCGSRRVSLDSLSTASKDKTSLLILRKLSPDPLPITRLALLLIITRKKQASCRKVVGSGGQCALLQARDAGLDPLARPIQDTRARH